MFISLNILLFYFILEILEDNKFVFLKDFSSTQKSVKKGAASKPNAVMQDKTVDKLEMPSNQSLEIMYVSFILV